ncbi:MAG: serine/threonine protein kinase [Pyrinomonadaceae bacterium]|nr:serine/threonine protein kinase [Pyrinomonadaceae bacterium]
MDVPQFIAGRFRIECEIGRGGMGTVYRATHLGLERPVAVKIIKQEFASDRDVADRFLREARTMAKLRHRHAAMIFDAGNLPDGRHFIIMEFVEGTTLSEALVRDVRFSPERAVKIAVQICDVLEEAHQLGIIHRDLKPSNIMLNERGVCVLDFGVAKVLVTSAESTATHATTGSGQLVGTPRYMSPEQCLGQRVGARSDLYSLGVVLYEMLAGRPPFIDPLPSAVLVKQATAPPPPLPQLRHDIPKQLALAVHSLLAKRPEERPRTAAAARAMLENSLIRPEPVPEADPLSSTMAVLAQRSSIVFRVAAPLATVVFLGALLFVWGNRGETAVTSLPDPSVAAQLTAGAVLPSRVVLSEKKGPSSESTSADSTDATFAEPTRAPSLTLDRARRIAATGSQGYVGDVQILQVASGAAVAAIQDERIVGAARFLLMEKRGGAFRVSARGPLDTRNFRNGDWTAETIDADADDYDEVLFTGTETKGRTSRHRLVLYVPTNREMYVFQFERNNVTGRLLKTSWSKSALSPNGSIYGRVLRSKANKLVNKMRSR